MGFRIHNFAYITDANFINEKELQKLRGVKCFVVNALRKKEHISHFNLQQAVELAQKVGAEQTYLTHISHLMGFHEIINTELPPHIKLAYDELVLEL